MVHGVLARFRLQEDLAGQHGESVPGTVVPSGSWRRILLLPLVILGSGVGIGLILAAKSLPASKELDSRPFAEYYLIGTPSTSVVVATGTGLLVSALLGSDPLPSPRSRGAATGVQGPGLPSGGGSPPISIHRSRREHGASPRARRRIPPPPPHHSGAPGPGVLLDAGNTLVFVDRHPVLEIYQSHGGARRRDGLPGGGVPCPGGADPADR